MGYQVGSKVLVALHLVPASLVTDGTLAERLEMHTGIVKSAPVCCGTYEVDLKDGSTVSAYSSDLSPS